MFDSLAADWHTRVTPQRNASSPTPSSGASADAPPGLAVEVGSGIGTYTAMLVERWGRVVAVDLSLEMLRRSPPAPGWRVQADAAALPLADGAAAAVVLVNAFLFPAEVDRVLAPDGLVVWVNSSGERTPIHLSRPRSPRCCPASGRASPPAPGSASGARCAASYHRR